MANEIDLVVGSEAFAQITKLLVELGKVDASFTELSAKFAALGNNANTVKNTADLAKLTAENAKLNAVIEQQIKDFTDLNAKLAQATTARTSTTKAVTEATIAQRELNTQTTLNIKATTDAVGAYAKLDAQHKLAVKTAQDLAVATGRTGDKYEEAKNKANELGNRLRVIDTDIGKHTRNVGNYSSSWNGLGNSINQLTREAPAFANSVQTGFMALSNNIPILADELGVLIQKNKDLQAEGKPTQSILKTLAGAFFSWQTAISLGVTLLTVYGAKIWDTITGAKAKEEALKKETEALEEKTKAEEKDRDVIASKQADEISRSQLLLEKAKNLSLTYKERTEAVKELKDRYPDFLKSLSDEKILAGETADAEDRLNSALINRGFALAAQEGIQENLKQELDLRLQFGKVSEKALKIRNEESLKSKEMIFYTDKEDQAKQQKAENERNQILEQDKLYQIKLKNLRSERQTLLDLFNENSKYLGVVKEVNKEKDKKSKTPEEKEEERLKREYEALLSNLQRQKEIDKDTLESFEGTIEDKTKLSIQLAQDEINIANVVFNEKERLAKKDVNLITVANNEKEIAEENAKQENIKRVKKYYEEQSKLAAEYAKKLSEFNVLDNEEYKKYLKDKADYLKSTLQEIENYLQSFSTDFASSLGLKETFDFFVKVDEKGKTMWEKLDMEGVSSEERFKARFNAIAESSQEMFNKMAEYSMANYEQEYARLEAQKEQSLKFAGDSAAAKEKIEADFAKKKKEIDKKKFEDEKKISMVNIVIDTAQAVVAALPNIPLSVIVGVLGAAQLAMVATQQFPAYAEGTDNHRGGLMLVNDGAGSNYQEKVVLPSGKVIRPQGRNVLMDAPKGTKVLNHEQQLFEMLQSNNISMLPQQSSGMTPEEMDEILGKHFGNIKTQNTIFDKNGFQTYVRNGNSITRSNSNRSQAIGISV